MKDYEMVNFGPCPYCAGSGICLNDTYVGHLIRTKRQAKHITATELAAKVGISAQYLGDLERGRRNWRHYLVEQCLNAIGTWEIPGWIVKAGGENEPAE